MLSGLFRTTKMKPWEIPARPGESAADHKERKRQTYFNDQRENNQEWFKRMDFQFDVRGLRVLDLGCGHGALSIAFAEQGAQEVVGIDLDDDRIDFANRNLHKAFPDMADRIQFRCENVLDMEDQFDLIVSKDAFEHIDDLDGVINHLHRLLKPGGRLAPGFSPLYFSPFGDHARYEMNIPWAHAVLPERTLVWWLNQRKNTGVANSMDLGLNRLTPHQFRRIFADSSKWHTVRIRYNQGDNRLFPVFDAMRQFAPIEKYFTTSIYAVAQKTTD